MIAVALDPARVGVAVAGRGAPALRRARLLAAGAEQVLLFWMGSDAPGALPANVTIRPEPAPEALAGIGALWITGIDDAAAACAAMARSVGVLVNVEDRRELCDFHSVAELRRGDLLLTVSTGGRSPGLAARIRARLAELFGPEWATRTEALGARRLDWRTRGLSLEELARQTDHAITAAGWMP